MDTNERHTTVVWDVFVRVFHWAIVSLVLISLVSGQLELGIHPYSGYAIFILVIARILWGLVGSQYARFSNFLYKPTTVWQYLKSIVKGNPKRFLGHNPAGGLMVLALLICLGTTTLSGMKLYGIEENEGPFAQAAPTTLMLEKDANKEHEHDEDHEDDEFWEALHELSINLLLLLILLHVLGVVVASKQHNENLVKAMLDGEKSKD